MVTATPPSRTVPPLLKPTVAMPCFSSQKLIRSKMPTTGMPSSLRDGDGVGAVVVVAVGEQDVGGAGDRLAAAGAVEERVAEPGVEEQHLVLDLDAEAAVPEPGEPHGLDPPRRSHVGHVIGPVPRGQPLLRAGERASAPLGRGRASRSGSRSAAGPSRRSRAGADPWSAAAGAAGRIGRIGREEGFDEGRHRSGGHSRLRLRSPAPPPRPATRARSGVLRLQPDDPVEKRVPAGIAAQQSLMARRPGSATARPQPA